MKKEETLKETISGVLNERFKDTDLFLVDIKISPQMKICVFIDDTKNVSIEICAQTSRFLEEYLEQNNLVTDNYTLEVSSPGLDEPLKVRRQFDKALGKQVDILLKNGIKEVGILKALGDETITILIEEIKKKKEIIPEEIKTYKMEEIKNIKKHFAFK
ncbi:MAG: hypothetical protein M9887_02915 [Chitinophagales bacterium]|nr:hypothetical protein [Chitinophagales bacterium]